MEPLNMRMRVTIETTRRNRLSTKAAPKARAMSIELMEKTRPRAAAPRPRANPT